MSNGYFRNSGYALAALLFLSWPAFGNNTSDKSNQIKSTDGTQSAFCVQLLSFEKHEIDSSFIVELKKLLSNTKEARIEKIENRYIVVVGGYKTRGKAKKVLAAKAKEVHDAWIRRCLDESAKVEEAEILSYVGSKNETANKTEPNDGNSSLQQKELKPTPAEAKADDSSATLLKEAVEGIEKNDYLQAYKILKELFAKNMKDVQVNFYLGKASFELGKNDESIALFQRAIELKSDFVQARLELARAYLKQNNKKSAVEELKIALQLGIENKNAKDNAQALLASLEREEAKKDSKVNYGFELGYDSNVKNSSEIQSYLLPFIGLEAKLDNEKKSDLYFAENISFGTKKGMTSFDSVVYAKQFTNVKDSDFVYGNIELSRGFTFDAAKYALGVGYERFFQGGDDVLQAFYIKPSMEKKIYANSLLNISVKAGKKTYSQAINKYSNVNQFAIENTILLPFMSAAFIPTIGYEAERRVAKESSSVSFNALYFKLGLALEITPKISSYAYIQNKQKKYLDGDPIFMNNRNDNYNNLFFVLNFKNLLFGMDFYTSFSHTRNISNQQPYDYNKQTISSGFRGAF